MNYDLKLDYFLTVLNYVLNVPMLVQCIKDVTLFISRLLKLCTPYGQMYWMCLIMFWAGKTNSVTTDIQNGY